MGDFVGDPRVWVTENSQRTVREQSRLPVKVIVDEDVVAVVQ